MKRRVTTIKCGLCFRKSSQPTVSPGKRSTDADLVRSHRNGAFRFICEQLGAEVPSKGDDDDDGRLEFCSTCSAILIQVHKMCEQIEAVKTKLNAKVLEAKIRATNRGTDEVCKSNVNPYVRLERLSSNLTAKYGLMSTGSKRARTFRRKIVSGDGQKDDEDGTSRQNRIVLAQPTTINLPTCTLNDNLSDRPAFSSTQPVVGTTAGIPGTAPLLYQTPTGQIFMISQPIVNPPLTTVNRQLDPLNLVQRNQVVSASTTTQQQNSDSDTGDLCSQQASTCSSNLHPAPDTAIKPHTQGLQVPMILQTPTGQLFIISQPAVGGFNFTQNSESVGLGTVSSDQACTTLTKQSIVDQENANKESAVIVEPPSDAGQSQEVSVSAELDYDSDDAGSWFFSGIKEEIVSDDDNQDKDQEDHDMNKQAVKTRDIPAMLNPFVKLEKLSEKDIRRLTVSTKPVLSIGCSYKKPRCPDQDDNSEESGDSSDEFNRSADAEQSTDPLFVPNDSDNGFESSDEENVIDNIRDKTPRMKKDILTSKRRSLNLRTRVVLGCTSSETSEATSLEPKKPFVASIDYGQNSNQPQKPAAVVFIVKPTPPPGKIAIAPQLYECDYCDLLLTHKWDMGLHYQKFHSNKPVFKCDRCPRSFLLSCDWILHNERDHDCAPPLPSNIKDANRPIMLPGSMVNESHAFASTLYRRTEKEQSESKDLSCGVCEKTFTRKHDMKQHQREVHNIETCSNSSAGGNRNRTDSDSENEHSPSDTPEATEDHLKLLNDNKQWACYICGTTFQERSDWEGHFLTHETSIKSIKCLHCSALFTLQINADNHYIAAHPLETWLTRFPCTQSNCYAVFSTNDQLDSHITLFHKRKTSSVPAGSCDRKMLECLTCHKLFPTDTQLKYHQDRAHANLVCELCGRKFARKSRFEDHVKYHSNADDFKCREPDCGKQCTGTVSLKRHMLLRHPPPGQKFICETCGKVLPSSDTLNNHLRNHRANAERAKSAPPKRNVVTCYKCPFKCLGQQNLKRHMNNIHGPKNYVTCSICRKTMTALSYRIHKKNKNCHIRVQVVPSVLPSSQAESSAASKSETQQVASSSQDQTIVHTPHDDDSNNVQTSVPSSAALAENAVKIIQSKRGLTKSKSLQSPSKSQIGKKHNPECRICGAKRYSKSTMTKHFQKVHPDSKLFKCNKPDCQFESDTSAKLQEHLHRNHKEPRIGVHGLAIPADCYVCGENIPYVSRVAQHFQDKHPGLRPFKCPRDNCKYIANYKHDLNKHLLRSHATKEEKLKLKTLKCPLCSNSYYNSANGKKDLERHLNFHNNKRPYKCPHCPYAFFDDVLLRQHIKRVHPSQDTPCPHCEKVFTKKSSLNTHMERVHTGTHVCHICGLKFNKNDRLLRHHNYHKQLLEWTEPPVISNNDNEISNI